MIAMQLISNLEFLHFKTFVHRDIKPKNILIGTKCKQNWLFI